MADPRGNELLELRLRVDTLEHEIERLAGVSAAASQSSPLDEVWPFLGGGGVSSDGTVKGNTRDSVRVGGRLRVKSDRRSRVVVRTSAPEEPDESDDGTIEIGVYYL